MRKIQISIILVLLAAVAAIAVSFAGCSKSQTPNSASSQSSAFNINNYKQQLDNSLASLVQDGTITSDQEDKIINAYASMMSSRPSGFSGSRPSGFSGSRPSGASGSHASWNGSRPSGFTGSRTSGMAAFSPLSTLVKNKTITQAQSDAVTKALQQSGTGFGGFGGGYGRNRQSSQSES